MSDLKTAAMRYASLGYAVFPCMPGDKRPACEHGVNDATTDIDQVDRWWSDEPNCNIGLSCLNMVVVDDDSHTWLADNPDRAIEISDVPAQMTPRGGRHWIFGQPFGKSWKNSTSQLAAKVDTRATGGYIVVAPSIVGGKSYQWINQLDCDPFGLPEPPGWLQMALDRVGSVPPKKSKPAVHDESGGISEGKRNAQLASIAGAMRRWGACEESILAALRKENVTKCKPPLPDEEVYRIAMSISRYEPSESVDAEKGPWEVHSMTAAELDAAEFSQEYLIDSILVDRQPCILAGPKKCLKTSVLLDLGISLASGCPFLGCGFFKVNRAANVGIISGESGLATIQETARRICKAAGRNLFEIGGLWFSESLPRFNNAAHMKAVRMFAEDRELETLILDPTYLSMPGAEAGNLFIQGELLDGITAICREIGLTLILCHHTRKAGRDRKFETPELDDIAWAGFQEWARQWVLLNRRVDYEPGTGVHKLWMASGGSAGHSGLWGLDIEEGVRGGDSERFWEVSVLSAEDARAESEEERRLAQEAAKEKREQESLDKSCDRAFGKLMSYPLGCAPRSIGTALGWSGTKLEQIVCELLERGQIEEVWPIPDSAPPRTKRWIKCKI